MYRDTENSVSNNSDKYPTCLLVGFALVSSVQLREHSWYQKGDLFFLFEQSSGSQNTLSFALQIGVFTTF